MKGLIAAHKRHVFLKPGEVVVSRRPVLVSTVLGSCVAVTMFSSVSGIGAICHAMLPAIVAGQHHDLRYVDKAIRYIYRKIIEYGAQDDLIIKLFGGAQVLALNYAGFRGTIGEQNVARAQEIIALLGLTIDNADTGGLFGRKLFFSTLDGSVYVRRMGPKSSLASGALP